MVSRVIGLLLGSTVNCAESPMAVTGTAVTENTVSTTNATRINDGRNQDVCPRDRAARREVGPADRQFDRLPNNETIFTRCNL